ncbi:LuxR family transcriptional regulator [Amycolatopsis sp. WAC 04197]|uniref:helix-turn-helix transcriptional regulator n=1 Tax=Amycolatopsis sp. WAC 04197 TaxID=2203199 RepID=UPI000F7B07C5|nr:LuxR family transcriptional regulator [Amycolatopsis sp. WAC 04197]
MIRRGDGQLRMRDHPDTSDGLGFDSRSSPGLCSSEVEAQLEVITPGLTASVPWLMAGQDTRPVPDAPAGQCASSRSAREMTRGQDVGLAVACAEEALEEAPCRHDPLCVWRALVTLVSAGELVTVDEQCARLVEDVEPGPFTRAQRRSMMLRARARVARHTGDLPGARRVLGELIESDVTQNVRLLGVSWLVDVLLEEGAIDEAVDLMERSGLETAAQQWLMCRPMLLSARAAVRLATGAADIGFQDFLQAERLFEGQRMSNRAMLLCPTQISLAAKAAHRDEFAARIAGQVLLRARGWGEPRVLGMALGTLATVEDGPDACAQLTEAAELLEVGGARSELITVNQELARRLAARDDVAGARWRIGQAMGIAKEIGAHGRVRDLRAEFGGLTESVQLTRQESRVASLARGGHSNEQIAGKLALSLRGVEFHLSNVYRKLGVQGRRGLRDALGEQVAVRRT